MSHLRAMFLRFKYFVTVGLLILVGVGTIFGLLNGESAPRDEYTVVVDAGHGGVGKADDDKWDAVTGKYIQSYASGTAYKSHTEERLMLALSKRVRHYLELTRTEEGWREFETILRRFSSAKHFKRIRFNVVMSRSDGWKDRKLPREDPRVNDPYRLYDYPDPDNPGRMARGRLSDINAARPYLVLSLHMNPAGRGEPGGMGAVLTPGFQTFNLVRRVGMGQKPMSHFERSPWRKLWLIDIPGWSKFETARANTWIYFNGFWSKRRSSEPWLEKYRGYRHNMVTWPYADAPGWEKTARKHPPGPYALKHTEYRPEGPFWTREQSRAEYWRREGGVLGYGGDNHYASDELMRFVQQGARIELPARRRRGAMGEILPPFVSTYSLPTYTNAICAFLEIGHLNRERDRTLIVNADERDVVARSLAAGVYSLFAGLSIERNHGPYFPRGKALDFARYERLAGGNYFEAAGQ